MLVLYYFCLPDPLFEAPTSTVIESRNGELIGAQIATDGQWRFPVMDSIPEKFRICITNFEDAYFYRHPGFNPVSMLKAMTTNIQAGKIIRGGSTLTQQVIRLSRQNQPRSYFEKIIELVLATRLELRYSKEEILTFYASYAPFGGNVVGLEMASWRYFGIEAQQLSWAESATLAVLPNAPGLIYPGRNQNALRQKRNGLLKKLFEQHIIDKTTYTLALAEPLPQRPFPLPQVAPHLVQKIAKDHAGERVQTTLDLNLQQRVNQIVKQHYLTLSENSIYNSAVLVMDIHTRQVLCYVGNSPTNKTHQKDVDIIGAPRSTGSILKPFLYTAMLDAGELLPAALIADIPTQIAGYSPKNYDETYKGAVPADLALARSLNVPFVRLLQNYGLGRFRDQIEKLHLNDINKSADHYGLTLILGGAESNLWDLCKSYAALASTLNHFNETSSEYYTGEFSEPLLYRNESFDPGIKQKEKLLFDAGSIYHTFKAMTAVNRPEGDQTWEYFDSSRTIAWKTGTSYGNRDAWAIGVTPDYVVGVWTGNADGEGRPEMTGVSSAAPIMFDVFNILPRSEWFNPPYDAMTEVNICHKSGYLAGPACESTVEWVPINGERARSCPYHQWVHLDEKQQYRVNSSCYPTDMIINTSWFTLPPLMAYYYKHSNATYSSLPPYRKGCDPGTGNSMQFIFPKQNASVVLPKDFEGNTNELILKIAHDKPENSVFWYVDDQYIGMTQEFHEMAIKPEPGYHRITALDENGIEITRTLKIETTD
ncbi:penicillin-binding protein 1C [Robertkochia solimangrovi]|uniref:penicillin-binding protein 1C n=1 Tax=Robertkochia solimangrovi TaxID=2213046 RepID=UPI001F5584AE|nr:penicillin-binding protein 1C [Robertkochia solimangrovi]